MRCIQCPEQQGMTASLTIYAAAPLLVSSPQRLSLISSTSSFLINVGFGFVTLSVEVYVIEYVSLDGVTNNSQIKGASFS